MAAPLNATKLVNRKNWVIYITQFLTLVLFVVQVNRLEMP